MGIKGGSASFFPFSDPFLFPRGITSKVFTDMEHIDAAKTALKKDRLLAVFPELPPQDLLETLPSSLELKVFEFNKIAYAGNGVLARVVKHYNYPDGSVKVVMRGISRISFESMFRDGDGVLFVRYSVCEDRIDEPENESAARFRSVLNSFLELSSMIGVPEDFQLSVQNCDDPGKACDMIADELNFRPVEKFLLQSLYSVRMRMDMLALLINREIETTRLGIKIQTEVHHAMNENQREFFLREQLRAIQNELGEDSRNPDVIELEKRLAETTLPEEAAKVVKKELSRLGVLPQASPEYHISYTYISWLLDVPWQIFTEDSLDCRLAGEILDEDHYGLEDVKKRILEFLAVLQLRGDDPEKRAPILCLVGPPGVGKTSLGKSIARSMNRKFVRMSLGGVRDEAEIRGHRRTYVGAMPGRILQSLKRAGANNPVFMLDEIDKLASDVRGDPASALLEVLDPAQNSTFSDNYLEIDYDLSRVFFIATANVIEKIPAPLLDRMEVIRLPGYTAMEKREIAKHYLVPRQLAETGLDKFKVSFRAAAIDELISYYTLEAGVRNLERSVAQVCRRIAGRIVAGEIDPDETIIVDKKLVNELLGARKYLLDMAEKNTVPGRAAGLAWTGAGGVILPIEVLAVPGGKGVLKLTGSLGKVMQESAETAFTLVRSVAGEYGVDEAYFTANDFHLHVPDGATPKDGPSAGITMTMALLSLARGVKIRDYVAMTGEITLHGKVTAVGGIKEKMVAALRAGMKEIIMPEENRKDYQELPDEVKSKMKFHFVSDFRSALKIAFAGGSK